MKERELQSCVIDMARTFGWIVAHFRTAVNKRGHYQTPVGADGKGFPDLCCIRDRVVFIELKVGSNKLSPDQEMWRDRILRSTAEWYLLTDKGWMAGQAEEILR